MACYWVVINKSNTSEECLSKAIENALKMAIYRISENVIYLYFRHKYEFLHNKMTPDIRITVSPKKIGVLLDYENSKLSFFNVDISQHLYTFSCQLPRFAHPCFSLEKPGSLKVLNGISMPKHVTFY